MSIVEKIAEEIKHKVDTADIRVWKHLKYSALNDYYESLTTGVVDNDIISDFASDVAREFEVESDVRERLIGKNKDVYIIIEISGYYALVVIEIPEQIDTINISVMLFQNYEEANAKIEFLEEDDDEGDEAEAMQTDELGLIEIEDDEDDAMQTEELVFD